MFVDAEKLCNAVGMVQNLASLDKSQPGVLFDIHDDSLDVYYNTRDKAILVTVPASIESDEIRGKVVFNYKRLTDTLNYCKPSGKVGVDSLEMKFERAANGTGGICKVNVVKSMAFLTEGGTNNLEVSRNTYELSWWDTEHLGIAQKILSNPACDDMFNEVDADLWERSELIRVLNASTCGDGRTVYMSRKYNGIFNVNTNSITLVRIHKDLEKVTQMSSTFAKALSSILSSVKDEDIYLNTVTGPDGKLFACIIFNAEHTLGIYLGAAAIVTTDLVRVGRSVGILYNTFQLNVVTEVLKDSLRASVGVNAEPDSTITIENSKEHPGMVDIVIQSTDSGASVNNEYRIHCLGFSTVQEPPENSEVWFKFNVHTKLLLDIVNSNKFDYTAIDIEQSPSGNALRIGFIDFDRAKEVREEYKANQAMAPEDKLSVEEKMSIRSGYLDTCTYLAI